MPPDIALALWHDDLNEADRLADSHYSDSDDERMSE